MTKLSLHKAKPFLKWAGGKGQLISQLDSFMPLELHNSEFTYIEPFVGGGAMLFHVLQNYSGIKRAIINDINPYLAATYQIIKEKPHELIDRLRKIEEQYFNLNSEEKKKEFYLDVRKCFNENEMDGIDRAKCLIFLNRTCFNGLYRENSKGKFNVPFGRNLHPLICNEETILADSKLLNDTDVVILNGDYSETMHYIDSRDLNFIYFDPPYRPLNSTSNFNSYVKYDFNDNEQMRLGKVVKELSKTSNVYWMLSNSDCSAKNEGDQFFENLYNSFYINRVYASRAINANPEKRGKLTELLICNYKANMNYRTEETKIFDIAI